jgi:peroxiredoxin
MFQANLGGFTLTQPSFYCADSLTYLSPGTYLPGLLRGFFDRKLLPTEFIAAMENEHLIRRVQLLGTQRWRGEPYQVVRLEYQRAGSSDIETDEDFIGRDFLIHHVTSAWGTTRVQADLSDLHIDPPLTPTSFAYAPPAAARVNLTEPDRPTSTLALGTPAPDFTLNTADGTSVHLVELRGKVVVLDFWATWCGNCVQEFPGDSALARKYAAQGVVVLAVDVCDAPDVYRRWLARHPDYSALVFALDPQDIHGKEINRTLYKGSSLPEQYVIDRTGHLTATISGYDGDAKETILETAIKKACGQ